MRILVQDVAPVVPGGFPKTVIGDAITVSATVIRDGHEVLRAVVRHRPSGGDWVDVPMDEAPGTDRWSATFHCEEIGDHEFQVAAWTDRYASWRHEMHRRIEGGQTDLASELLEGIALIDAADIASDDPAVAAALAALRADDASQAARVEAALSDEIAGAMATYGPRSERVETEPHRLIVDRERAAFGTWYELFPRSWGGFRGVTARLDRFAELGVDVLYLPPIHPIGLTHRKGRDNSLTAAPGDPGSPWAIGDATGGHTAIHPDLGTPGEFRELVNEARDRGIDIALDFALQCSPDHPWLREHPDWFSRRPDGTLKYAENPPKKYQDIYNVDFDCEDWRGLWQALADVIDHWIGEGVRVFRVDNPHTKPIRFWKWLLARVRAEHPDVVFLAEAFTRPALMYELGAIGFQQSYTYFTWRNGTAELGDYIRELASPEVARSFRPNFFVNTPDILTEYLQQGGEPAFRARLVLAATLSPSYGIYSGFENIEHTPVRRGSEEYADSEKYAIRSRDLDGPLLPLFRDLNRIRRRFMSLHRISPVDILSTEDDALMAYARGRGTDALIVVVNTDPVSRRVGLVTVTHEIGLPDEFQVIDHLGGGIFDWRTGGNYVALEPGDAHIVGIRR